jgi:hypothetical protein
MEFFEQVLSIIALIFGLVLGEFIASRAFGRPRVAILFFVEIILYAIIIVAFGDSIFFYQFDLTILGTNFVIGFLASIVVRAVSTAIGAAAAVPEKVALGKYSREEKLLIETAKALAAHGMEIEEIKKIAATSGFSRKTIKEIFSQHRFEVKPHPLVQEVARLEEIVAELRRKTKS